jgi:RHS repeat-associated protein
VDFYVDGTLTGTAASAPYTFSWSSPSIGTHTVTAVAVDSQGASTTSAARTVTVSNQNQLPTVSIVTPTDNSLWHSPASFMFQANASSGEANDTVTVQFYVNGVLQGSDSTSPYSINLSSLAAGTYTLMARAIDGQSAQVDSVTRTITVSDTNAAPTVTISTPTNNANYPMAPAGFTINATASAGEVNGWVTRVEFYVNGNLVNTDTSGPWSYPVSGLANGTYALTAKAFDELEASTTSAPITVTVGPQPKMYFIHTDHLDTPRLITDANQQVVWRDENAEPFGDSPADENPSGLGSFEFPMTVSLYYNDKETGNAYATQRDCYVSGLGRFCVSDPIGLEGGINTYTYVRGSPLRYSDPEGLFDPAGFGAGVVAVAGVAVSTVVAVAAGAVAVVYPSSIANENAPSDRPWRKRKRWLVYVRCNVNMQENCQNCPPTIGGKAFGNTFPEANAFAQADANANLGWAGARGCQARHCHAIKCFENGREVRCPTWN